MIINTKFFNEIEIDNNDIIEFKNGIPGFEKDKEFVILDVDGKVSLKCFQSLQNVNTCLLVTTPWEYFKDYEIDLSEDEICELEVNSPDEVIVYNIITVRDKNVTANLLAPIIVNTKKNIGMQIILANSKYEIRQEISCLY